MGTKAKGIERMIVQTEYGYLISLIAGSSSTKFMKAKLDQRKLLLERLEMRANITKKSPSWKIVPGKKISLDMYQEMKIKSLKLSVTDDEFDVLKLIVVRIPSQPMKVLGANPTNMLAV
ncbi:hypothetical protein POM88_051557 [Heracleum sosnowskyi]|uniref:Uncharacterized protein n=1 Tax=Heracleum sosnowskyi TaxID=360622 RepID=A0AAD8H2G6_9APIA|nr:hypothetical protein POM88_051557 [Heracleum sosnowskyi]